MDQENSADVTARLAAAKAEQWAFAEWLRGIPSEERIHIANAWADDYCTSVGISGKSGDAYRKLARDVAARLDEVLAIPQSSRRKTTPFSIVRKATISDTGALEAAQVIAAAWPALSANERAGVTSVLLPLLTDRTQKERA